MSDDTDSTIKLADGGTGGAVIPREIVEAAKSIIVIDEVTEMADREEGRLMSVDGENYYALLLQAEVLARWIIKQEEIHAR